MMGTLNPTQIEQLLHACVVGRIGCHSEGRTYVVPVTYAYDGACVYAHSAEGMKIHYMRANPRVCFEVDQMDGLADWRSVIAWGTYEELTGDAASAGLGKLVERVMPLMTSESAVPTHGMEPSAGPPRVPVIFRIRLDERTGRFERRT